MADIKTQWLREVHEFELGVIKYREEYRVTRSESSLSKMYTCLRGMLYKMVANYRPVEDVANSIDYLVNELSNEVISKIIKNPEYKVYAWHSYLKLSILHIRDDYFRQHSPQVVKVDNIESVNFKWSNPEWIENRNQASTGDSSDKPTDLYTRSKMQGMLFEGSINTEISEDRTLLNVIKVMNLISLKSLEAVNDSVDVKPKTPLYYRNCLDILTGRSSKVLKIRHKECEEVISNEYK